MVENVIEEIGYEMSGRIKVHYCVPWMSVSRNGLREIKTAADTEAMSAFLSNGHHFLSIYLDHDESLRSINWDDVVEFPVANLPAVISPAKPLQVVYEEDNVVEEDCIGSRTRMKGKRPASVIEEEDGSENDDKDSDFELAELLDSEYGISEDDDDLYEDNVDEEDDCKEQKAGRSAVKGKANACKEEYIEEEDEWPPELDDEAAEAPVGNRVRVKTFREVDLQDPKFEVGLIFESVEVLRKAIKAYSCVQRKDIRLPVNDRRRLRGKCKEDCSWYLWASYDSRTKCFRIKKYNGEHTCSSTFNVHGFTANFLAEKYVDSFRADQDMNMKNFARIVQKDWNMTPGRSKLQRARRLALKVIYGDEEGQYNRLWDYANEIRRSNPGSSFFLALDEQSRFKRCYMSIEACKLGFLQGCRPIIFVDGCHIKTRHRGQLLTAVGMDPNNCIFPIAIAAVEMEDTANWTWFLETLKNDLGIINTLPWTLMSDKQKVHYLLCFLSLLSVFCY